MAEAVGGTVGEWTAKAAGVGSAEATVGETAGDAVAAVGGVSRIGGKPRCSSKEPPYMVMSSMYTSITYSTLSLKILSIHLWNVAGAL